MSSQSTARLSRFAVSTPASAVITRRMRPLLAGATFTLFALMILTVYLSPFGYMTATSLKNREMISQSDAPLWPAREASYTYEGQDYPIYYVPAEDGEIYEWALYIKGRESSSFIDPDNPEAGPIEWQGRWRTLKRAWVFSPLWENFSKVWVEIRMPLLLRNTFAIAVIGAIGTTLSSIVVAYGFSRFHIPGQNILFMLLISTIILPRFITLIPTYIVFQRIGWVGTWLPLIVPHFFANAYNVFLLRQFFMTIPRELDEAAMIDGASPLRTLISVVVPQAWPAIIAVSLFHFVWAWNEYFEPLVYLSTARDLQPIAVGIQDYNAIYASQPQLVQASSLLGLLVPVFLFLIAQRFFIQGSLFTGVEK